MTSTSFTPSLLQSAIDAAVFDPNGGNLCVEAAAGAAKTTTIVWIASRLPVRLPGQLLPQNICFLAFNKNIAEELQRRCPSHVRCSTFHSLGLRALKTIAPKLKVDARKVLKIVWQRTERGNPDQQNIIRLVGLLKSRAPNGHCEAVDWLAVAKDILLHHDLSFDNERKSVQIAVDVFHKSNADLSTVDFDDMLFLPILHNCAFDQQDWVFVDEAQDLNEIQHQILGRLAKQTTYIDQDVDVCLRPSPTRFVFVGDPNQSIYGFRGAFVDSMQKLSRRFNCSTLPLSVSYRCSKAVVAEAQKYCK